MSRVEHIVDYIMEYGLIGIEDSLDVICEVNALCKKKGIRLSWSVVECDLRLIKTNKLKDFWP